MGAIWVERQVGKSRKQQCPRTAELVFHPRGELATKEDGTARIDRSQCSGSFGEINRLDEPSVQVAGFVNVGIEIGQALDVDQTSGSRRCRPASHNADSVRRRDCRCMSGDIMFG
jgi:hypothetical protein